MTRQMFISVVFGMSALCVGFFILLYMPHERYVSSLGVFLFKLLPFFLAAISISLLDVDLIRGLRLQPVLIISCFLLFFAVYVPKMFFDVMMTGGENVYYRTLVIVPVIILSLTLAYRLGGASSGETFRLAVATLLVMLSGIEDLAFFFVNTHEPGRFNPIPEVWDWVSHIEVRLGHPPTKYEVYGFIVVHWVLAALVLFYPFRFLQPLKRPLGIQ